MCSSSNARIGVSVCEALGSAMSIRCAIFGRGAEVQAVLLAKQPRIVVATPGGCWVISIQRRAPTFVA